MSPSASANSAYLAKYQPVMDDDGWTLEWLSALYPVTVRIAPTKYRYW
jgi:hypothetical protein